MLGLTMGWTLDPVLLVPLGLALLIFVTGWVRLSRRASARPSGTGLSLSGWTVLTLALIACCSLGWAAGCGEVKRNPCEAPDDAAGVITSLAHVAAALPSRK